MGHGCCYARGAACLAVPTWTLLQGCSAAGLVLTSRQCFQAFNCVPAVSSTGNTAFCHDFLQGFDSLCLPDTGVEQGVPCGRCCGPHGCLIRSLQHTLTWGQLCQLLLTLLLALLKCQECHSHKHFNLLWVSSSQALVGDTSL